MEGLTKRLWGRARKFSRVLLLGFATGLATLLLILLVCPPAKESEYFTISLDVLISGMLAACFCIFVCWLRRPGNKKRLAIVCGCGLMLLILARTEENWRGKRAWDNFRREWEAKGEKFDFKDFVPPPVPADQNFALTPIVASCYGNLLDTNGNAICPSTTNVVNRLDLRIYGTWRDGENEPTNGAWSRGTITDLRGWEEYYQSLLITNESGVVAHEFSVPSNPQTPAADVLLALSKYEGALKELAEASRLPESRFPLNYDCENPAAILLPQLAAMKQCAQTLQLRALAELEAGQSLQAGDDVVLIFRLTEKVRKEPFGITHLVRMGMMQIAVQVIYEGLATHRWTEAELIKISEELKRQNLVADCKYAMRGEIALHIALVDYFRENPQTMESMPLFDDNAGIGFCGTVEDPNWLKRLLLRAIPPGWFDQNQVDGARAMVESVIPIGNDTNRTFSVKMYGQAESSFRDYKPFAVFRYFRKLFTPVLAQTKKFAFCQTALNLADTAIALERYRLARGNYPESLDSLAPQFIAQLPTDVVGGKTLKYRQEAGGWFILYSVGWNETDDGGVVVYREFSPNTVDTDKGDWVWRYPAR